MGAAEFLGRVGGENSEIAYSRFSDGLLPELCSGVLHHHRGFSKPDLSNVRIGMAKQEVIDSLGKPDSVAAKGQTEYLGYGWDIFMDGIVGSAEWYFVRIVGWQS